jgi:hypothetical protein
MVSRCQIPFAIVVVGALLAACGGGTDASSSDPDPNNQVQVATSEKAREDTANVSARLKAAGYNVLGAVPAGPDTGGFAVLLEDGGVVVILVLDSSSQADIVEQGMKQAGASSDALVAQAGKHVYAANTAGAAGVKVEQDVFDKLVAAGEAT